MHIQDDPDFQELLSLAARGVSEGQTVPEATVAFATALLVVKRLQVEEPELYRRCLERRLS
jgi:hypothetical protein